MYSHRLPILCVCFPILCVCVSLETHMLFFFSLLDPGIQTEEERLTPLHFAARYTPRNVEDDAQEGQSTGTDSSKEAVAFLVSLRREGVKVRSIS